MIKLKGHEFNTVTVKDSSSRRAQRFFNNIIVTLRAIGLTEDDVECDLERVAIKNVPAKISWYVDGFRLHFAYSGCNKYVENLYVVSKLIELEVEEVVAKRKTLQEFIDTFSEEDDVEEQRKAAREHLGLDADTTDLDLINKTYKKMAKAAHPDMPEGSTEKFKELNNAHKILKRELS